MFKGCEVCRLKTSPDRYCFYCERDREPVKARKKKRQRKQVMKYNPAEREAYLAYFRQLRKGKGKREQIYERDGKRCIVCGCDDKRKLTLDHIIPQSLGG